MVAEPPDTSIHNALFELITHRTSEEVAVEARAAARAAADEEAADEVAVKIHSNVVAAQEAEMTILPADMAGILVHPRKENATSVEILITPPIPATRPKTFVLSSSLRKPDTRTKRSTPT